MIGMDVAEAVDCACRLIGKWAREECAQVSSQATPAIDAIAAEIADLEALIEARPARAQTLRPLVQELRERQSNYSGMRDVRRMRSWSLKFLRRRNTGRPSRRWRKFFRQRTSRQPAAALRSLIGSIPIFEDSGQLYGRIGINPLPLFQSRNPQTFGGLVAGAGYGLFLARRKRSG